MAKKKYKDYGAVEVRMLDQTTALARSFGTDVAWMCNCGLDTLPMLVNWYTQRPWECPKCGSRYQYTQGGPVKQITAPSN